MERKNSYTTLLTGAGDIIQALITNPNDSKNMDAYKDGPNVVSNYLYHLGKEPKELDWLLSIFLIKFFLEDKTVDWGSSIVNFFLLNRALYEYWSPTQPIKWDPS